MDWSILIFSIPEGMVIAWIACALCGVGTKYKSIITIGGLTGLVAALIKPFVSYGPNIFIYAFLLISLFSVFRVSKIGVRVVATALAVCIYLTIELLNVSIFITVTEQHPQMVFESMPIAILLFLPQVVLASLAAFFLTKYKFTFF